MEEEGEKKSLDDILSAMREDKSAGSSWSRAIILSLMLKDLAEKQDDRFFEAIDLIIESCKIQIDTGSFPMIQMMFGQQGFEPVLNQIIPILEVMLDHERLLKVHEMLGWQYYQQGRSGLFEEFAFKIVDDMVKLGRHSEAMERYEKMLEAYKADGVHINVLKTLVGIAKSHDYRGDLIQAEKYYDDAVEYARKNRGGNILKFFKSEADNFKKKKQLLELGAKWKLNKEVSDATMEISIDKGKKWMSFPINPTSQQLFELKDKLAEIYNVKKVKNIRYYFKGTDAGGNVIKDDNNGKYYMGFT